MQYVTEYDRPARLRKGTNTLLQRKVEVTEVRGTGRLPRSLFFGPHFQLTELTVSPGWSRICRRRQRTGFPVFGLLSVLSRGPASIERTT